LFLYFSAASTNTPKNINDEVLGENIFIGNISDLLKNEKI